MNWVFENYNQILSLRDKIMLNTESTVDKLLSNESGIRLLYSIKFKQIGYDSITEKSTNFIEQVNQTFTYLVSLQAIEHLMHLYPCLTFQANFGVKSGYDDESLDGSIICECFAATTPNSNNKLEKDVKRLFESASGADKYVIYYAEQDKPIYRENLQKKYSGVSIVSLTSIY